MWWNYSQFTLVSEREINPSVLTLKHTNYSLCWAGCSKELLFLACRAFFLPPALCGSQGLLWVYCLKSQWIFPAFSNYTVWKVHILELPLRQSALWQRKGRICLHTCSYGQVLHPGEREVWEMLLESSIYYVGLVGNAGRCSSQRRALMEPRTMAGGQWGGTAWSCGSHKVALENWEIANLRNTMPLCSSDQLCPHSSIFCFFHRERKDACQSWGWLFWWLLVSGAYGLALKWD